MGERLGGSKIFFVVVATLSTVLLSFGCAVDHKKEIGAYRSVVDLKASTRPAFVAGEALSLRQAMLLTNARNERLSIEGENYLQALIDVRRAVAGFLPTISLSPSYTFRQKVNSPSNSSGGTTGAAAGGGSSASNTIFDAPVDESVNLFNGFRDVNAVARNNLTVGQRRALLLDAQEALLSDVVRVYYQVLTGEASVRVLRSSIDVQEARLREVRGKSDAGVARPLDVAQVEAQVSATRVTLIDAENQVQNARAALEFLTGEPVEKSTLTDLYVAPNDLATEPSLEATALSRRSDVSAAFSFVGAARRNVDVAVGQYYPSVTLDLGAYLYRESVPDDRVWEGLLRANLPIFSAGLIEADVRTAWSQFRQALLNHSQLRRQVVQQVKTAVDNFQSSRARLTELRIRVASASQALRQAEESYAVGLATNLDRVTSQADQLSAQLALSSEEYNQKITYLDLLRAVGVLREGLELAMTANNEKSR